MNKLKSLSLSTHKKIYYILLAAGIITVLTGSDIGSRTALNPQMLLGLALIVGSSAWSTFFLRCPNCGSQFRWNQSIPKTCPKCGRKIL